MRKLLAVACAAALLVACGESDTPDRGGDSPPPPSGPDVDAKGLWTLESGHSPSGEIEVPDGTRITMEVLDDEIRGSAGCNSYGIGITIEGDTFASGGPALTTEIACPPEIARVEERFIEAIDESDTIARSRRTLTLTGPDTELVFRLVPPIDPKPLTGTTWVLDTLVDGDLASSTLASADAARLVLNDDGTLEGTTGCRSFTGGWEVSGDVVSVTSMVFEGDCRTAAEQDSHVVSVLGGGFRAERDADRLTLTAEKEDDLGLVYRAR